MDRSRAAFSHAFRAAVGVRRGRRGMAVLDLGNIDGGNRRVVAEGAGQHIANGVVNAGFHQGRADPVRGRTVDLAFDDRGIDYGATIVDGDVVKNLRDKSFAIDFDDSNVQLRRVGQGETAVLCFCVRNLEGRAPNVAAIQRYIVEFGREQGSVHVHNVGEAPVVDGFSGALLFDFGALLADSEFEIVFFGF